MLLEKSDFDFISKTLNEDVFNDIGLLLEKDPPSSVRSNRIVKLIHPLYEGIISDEVLETTDFIFNEFMKRFQEIVSDKIPGNNITINAVLGQKNIPFTIYWNRVDDRKQMRDPIGGSIFRYNGKMIMADVSFTIYKKLTPSSEYRNKIKDAILHELDHIYENSMMGHTYYNVEIGGLSQSKINSANEAERMIAHILYASHEGEQNAMCAELYSQLLRSNLNRPKHSGAYDWLENLYIAHDYLIKHKDDPELMNAIAEYSKNKHFYDVEDENNFKGLPIPRVKKPFDINLGYKYFKRRADKGIKRFEHRIAQTLKKAKYRVLGPEYSNNPKYYRFLL